MRARAPHTATLACTIAAYLIVQLARTHREPFSIVSFIFIVCWLVEWLDWLRQISISLSFSLVANQTIIYSEALFAITVTSMSMSMPVSVCVLNIF